MAADRNREKVAGQVAGFRIAREVLEPRDGLITAWRQRALESAEADRAGVAL